MAPSKMGYLGVAVLGVAVLGTAVLGVAVLHRPLTHSFSPAVVRRPAHLSEHHKAWQSQVHVAVSYSQIRYLGVAVLGVAVLGTAVLGVAVLGTTVLHRPLTHSFSPALDCAPLIYQSIPKCSSREPN